MKKLKTYYYFGFSLTAFFVAACCDSVVPMLVTLPFLWHSSELVKKIKPER